MATTVFAEPDFFTDHSVLLDPYEALDAVRSQSPVRQMENHDFVMVTGFAEATAILLDGEHFSSVIAAAGPTAPLPFEPKGNDITAQIAEHHHEFVGHETFLSYDGREHSARRALLNGLFAPSRLKANELYMQELANRMVSDVVARGGCEIMGELATPYVTYVIADLLGVPKEDRAEITETLANAPLPGAVDDADAGASLAPLAEKLGRMFGGYIVDRRANPRDDVMSVLANTRFPDGTLPEVSELIMLAIFLFSAGQDTSAKLIGNSVLYLCDNQELQSRLRADRSLIAPFLEEMLRLEGSSKVTHRLVSKDTTVGGFHFKAGMKVVISLAGADRDPVRWEEPNTFRLDRPKVKEHLAFGRGAHTCIGNPLARAEVRVLFERLFDRTSEMTISETRHGPFGNRRLDYEPSYIVRGLTELHVDLKP
ncbi:cytochrome P450 [Novosphingobium malaysiense]|uniref:Cytochrome P450 n=1 Tax=Novosphingobium malaysiense TaxID=1348853 RepID=A0A0B1ZLY2_9SPHN|nr:cytochrome P450 [Novosphingobium malaysiense]KHK90188.1 cytochrome P450 [Novosphingobium malaysiense]